MKILTKDQAQAWLNQPEQEDIDLLECFGRNFYPEYQMGNRTNFAPFSVDYNGLLYRKKPWHWPEPDETTPVDTKVWCRNVGNGKWYREIYNRNGCVFDSGRNSWTSQGYSFPWNYTVLANPDNLDEMPPQGLEA
jgi:hypothetical protein